MRWNLDSIQQQLVESTQAGWRQHEKELELFDSKNFCTLTLYVGISSTKHTHHNMLHFASCYYLSCLYLSVRLYERVITTLEPTGPLRRSPFERQRALLLLLCSNAKSHNRQLIMQLLSFTTYRSFSQPTCSRLFFILLYQNAYSRITAAVLLNDLSTVRRFL